MCRSVQVPLPMIVQSSLQKLWSGGSHRPADDASHENELRFIQNVAHVQNITTCNYRQLSNLFYSQLRAALGLVQSLDRHLPSFHR